MPSSIELWSPVRMPVAKPSAIISFGIGITKMECSIITVVETDTQWNSCYQMYHCWRHVLDVSLLHSVGLRPSDCFPSVLSNSSENPGWVAARARENSEVVVLFLSKTGVATNRWASVGIRVLRPVSWVLFCYRCNVPFGGEAPLRLPLAFLSWSAPR